MKPSARKKAISTAWRVASRSMDNPALCAIPKTSNAAIGQAARGIVMSRPRSDTALMPHISSTATKTNSKMATDQGSTAPCARVAKMSATRTAVVMGLSINRTAERCREISQGYAFFAYPRLIYPHASGVRFGNLKVVVPDSTVRRLFVAELGFLLDRDHDRRLGRRELESLP